MKIEVKLFAVASQFAGLAVAAVDLRSPATVADLRRELLLQYPQLAPLGDYLRFAVDQEYVTDSAEVNATQEIAAIPPVSGG
ncbi:MAG TPA: MoaD/ThiS family protein [Pirellulales bacterium]|jgi:molybdopterin converting factor subunit 1|nr:MoaD/ThiS family protein [Pirellulales bacterium]